MAQPGPKLLRVMVDANVLVAGLGWPRWSYALLQHAVAGDYRLVLSAYVIEEARRHLARLAAESLSNLEEVLHLSAYEAVADPTSAALAAYQAWVRDPKDLPVAVAALHAQVDYLVSNDKDLTESAELTRRLSVRLPAVFLRDVMGWSSQELEAIRHRTWRDLA